MIAILRAYLAPGLALLLAAILAFTSQSMAVARGVTGPVGQVVLCTGTGPVAVFVDEDGQPTDPPHICPDCALHVLAAIAAPEIAPAPLAATACRQVFAHRALRAEIRTVAASARGPPASV